MKQGREKERERERKKVKWTVIANEDENTKKGESLFNTSWPLIGYSTDREGIARFSLRRKVRSALIIVNQTSGRRTVSAEEAPSCASTIIVEIGENIGAEEQGGGETERCLANMRGNGDREISTDRITLLGVVIFSHDKTAFLMRL